MRKIVLTGAGARDLIGLSAETSATMRALIRDYAAGVAVDASPLRGRAGEVRLKSGEHRVIVAVSRSAVTVLRVRHRSIVYRP